MEKLGISKYLPILFQGTYIRKHVEKWLMYCKLFKNSLTTYDVLESFENDAKPQLDLEGHNQKLQNRHWQKYERLQLVLAESAASASVSMTSIIIHDCQ